MEGITEERHKCPNGELDTFGSKNSKILNEKMGNTVARSSLLSY